MGGPGNYEPWVTDETPTGPVEIEDAINVQPRSVRATAGLLALVGVAVVLFGIAHAHGHHPGENTVITSPAAKVRFISTADGQQLYAAAEALCAPTACQVRAIIPSVLGSFRSKFGGTVEADGFTASGTVDQQGFVARLYTNQAVTILCRGRKLPHGARSTTPVITSPQIGVSLVSTTTSFSRDGWDLTVTLISGSEADLPQKAARAWLMTGALS